MDNLSKAFIEKLLQLKKEARKPFEITVTGISMQPLMREGDTVTVQSQGEYEVGDILVFNYKQGELLAHRLLLKKDGKYFCKGDNSFRIEDVTIERIVGKVILLNGGEVPQCTQKQIALSYAVSRQFRKCAYDIEKTKQTDVYRLYEKIYLKEECEDCMVYQKNKEMQYIQTDETSLSVYNPETGDAIFFDEKGIDILNALDEPRDLEGLIAKLCEIYDAAPDDVDVRGYVEKFLVKAVEEKVVLVL